MLILLLFLVWIHVNFDVILEWIHVNFDVIFLS